MHCGGDGKLTVPDQPVRPVQGARARLRGAQPWGRAVLFCLTAGLVPGLLGCGQQFGAFLYWTGLYPKPTVKAEFTLTEGPLLILVEDDYNVTRSQVTRNAIGAALTQELARHKVNRRVVPLERLDQLRQQDPC